MDGEVDSKSNIQIECNVFGNVRFYLLFSIIKESDFQLFCDASRNEENPMRLRALDRVFFRNFFSDNLKFSLQNSVK